MATLTTHSAYAADADPRLAQNQNGAALFQQRCAVCHAPGGMGWLVLSRRLPPDRSVLVQRTDLTADYVESVIRGGLGAMPSLSRVEVTNQEMAAIAIWLAGRKS